MLVCLLGIDSLCNFSLLCDPLLLTWHDARGNGCGLKWRQVRAQTPTFRHPRPLESLWYVITDIDCLLSWNNSPHPPHNPVAAWTLHGCNWMRVLQSCSGAVKTALWPDITDKWSLMLGWTECVCRCSVASCFVVVEVSFLISLDWFSQLRMNIGTTEAFFGRVCQQTPAGEKHQQCWAFIRKKTQLTWLFLFRPDLCWSSSAHQTLSFFFFFFFYSTEGFHSSHVSSCLCLSEICLFAFLWSLPSVGQFVCQTVFCSRLTENGKVTLWRHSPMEDHCCQKENA